MILGTAAYMAPEQAQGAGRSSARTSGRSACCSTRCSPAGGCSPARRSPRRSRRAREEIDLAALPPDAGGSERLVRAVSIAIRAPPPRHRRRVARARRVLRRRGRRPRGVVPARPDVTGVGGPAPHRRRPVAGALIGMAAVRPRAPGRRAIARRVHAAAADEPAGRRTAPELSPDGRQVLYTSRAAGNQDIYLLRVGGARAINLTAVPRVTTTRRASRRRRSHRVPVESRWRRPLPDGRHRRIGQAPDRRRLRPRVVAGRQARRVLDGRRRQSVWTSHFRGVVDRRGRDGQGHTAVRRGRGAAGVVAGRSRIAYWANTGGQRDIWTIAATAARLKPSRRCGDRLVAGLVSRRALALLRERPWRRHECVARGHRSGDRPRGRRAAAGHHQRARPGLRALLAGRLAPRRWLPERSNEQTIYAVAQRPGPSRCGALRTLATLRRAGARRPRTARIACSLAGPPEDLVVMRSDGREMRRLTSDVARDRNVTGPPTGSGWRSTRRAAETGSTGRSGPTVPTCARRPGASRDRTGLAHGLPRPGPPATVNVSKDRLDWNTVHPPAAREVCSSGISCSPRPGLRTGVGFVAGVESGASGRSAGYAIYDLRGGKSLRRLRSHLREQRGTPAASPAWLPDSRNLVLRGLGGGGDPTIRWPARAGRFSPSPPSTRARLVPRRGGADGSEGTARLGDLAARVRVGGHMEPTPPRVLRHAGSAR